LDLFNYYKREHQIFKIEKIHKNHDFANCPFIVNKLKLKETTNKNPIWKIQNASQEESNLFLISYEFIVNSYQSYNAFNENKNSIINFDYNFIKSRNSYNSNFDDNTDLAQLLNSTPNYPFKLNSTNVSINNKKNIDYSFNTKQSYFQDSNENSNDLSLYKLNESHGFKIKTNYSNNNIRTKTREINNRIDSSNFPKSIFNKSETNYNNEMNFLKNTDLYYQNKFIQEIKKDNNNKNNKYLNGMNKSNNSFIRNNLTDMNQQLQIIKTFNERTIASLNNSNNLLDINQFENFGFEDIYNEINDFPKKIKKFLNANPHSLEDIHTKNSFCN